MNSHAISVPNRVRMRFAAKSMTTTRQVRMAEVTDRPVAQLIRDMRRSRILRSAIQRSCSVPRLASRSGSISRDRSTIRESLDARTLRNAPMPLKRKTGARARRTISATVETVRSGCWRTFIVRPMHQRRRRRPESVWRRPADHEVADHEQDDQADRHQHALAPNISAPGDIDSAEDQDGGEKESDERADRHEFSPDRRRRSTARNWRLRAGGAR